MTNEEFVKSIYPDAKLAKYFVFNDWHPCIHSYQCGEMLDQIIDWKCPPAPKNEEEAWQQAAGWVNRKIIKKLES